MNDKLTWIAIFTPLFALIIALVRVVRLYSSLEARVKVLEVLEERRAADMVKLDAHISRFLDVTVSRGSHDHHRR